MTRDVIGISVELNAVRVKLILVLALVGSVIVRSSADAEPLLSISLGAPDVCETEAEVVAPLETMAVPWRVEGGTRPFQVLIDGQVFSGERGTVEVVCGKLDGWLFVSGITTI